MSESSMTGAQQASGAASARPADFPQLTSAAAGGPANGLDFVLDIPLHLSVRIGSARLLIRDFLQLGQGSIVELDRLAGEPMEVLVNGRLVARGEAVVINDKLGVRLTDVISPMERVQNLQ